MRTSFLIAVLSIASVAHANVWDSASSGDSGSLDAYRDAMSQGDGYVRQANAVSVTADVVSMYVDKALVSWVRRIAERSREMPEVRLGLSARACLALIRTSKAWAAAHGRAHVVPEDLVTLAPPILGHRLLLTAEATFGGTTIDELTRDLLDSVPAPADRA